MNKNEVDQWCIDNGYAIISIAKKDHISPEFIYKIAMEATGVSSIKKTDQKPQHSFARFLAITYLDSYYASGVLADMVNINYTTVSYARNLNLLNCEVKYFKKWQQSAILYFREKLDEAKNKFNEQ